MPTLTSVKLAGLVAALSACSVAAGLGKTTSTSSKVPVISSAPDAAAPAATGDAMIAVPDFTGKTLDEARALAKAAGFSHDVEERPMHCEGDVQKADGKITCQDPEPGKLERRYAGLGVAIHKEWKHEGMLVRAQLLPLIGMTPEQAQKRLQELGHTGKLVVTHELQFVPKCGQNKICSIEHEAGIGVADDMIVSINPKIEISAPPD
jgi:hypothetical protein